MSEPTSGDRSTTARAAVRPRSWYPWAVVAMLWFICFFNYADRQAIAAILPALEDEFGFTKSQLGLIGAAFMWVYALTAPFAGGVGDRTSRKLLILGGLYVWSIITGFTAACSKLWQFVFVRGAEGLGETFYFPASMSLVSDYHSKRTRSRAMSLHQTSVYAGTIGGADLRRLDGRRLRLALSVRDSRCRGGPAGVGPGGVHPRAAAQRSRAPRKRRAGHRAASRHRGHRHRA